MGTTTTPNLGLIKPDINESIRENLPISAGWPSQNGSNCDKIDLLFRKPEATYTPTLTATTTNPNIGSTGVIQAKYVRFAGKTVLVFFRILCGGTGISIGSGNYFLSQPPGLPVTTELPPSISGVSLGRAVWRDPTTVANCTLFNTAYDNNLGPTHFAFILPGANYWAGTPPLVSGGSLSGYAMYITSAA